MLSGSLLVLEGCKTAKPTTTTQTEDVGTFKDDLSAFRPTYQAMTSAAGSSQPVTDTKPLSKGIPSGDITRKLEVLLDTIAVNNQHIRYAQGYRVQIYSGSSSGEANRARDRSYALFPDITPHIVYIQPNFRVKVGDFLDRLEAQRVYVGLQAEFPNALIVPEKIEIR